MPPDLNLFVEKFNEVKNLYSIVKKIMLLAENLDEDKDSYLAPVNELRNVLDHIMRSWDHPEKLETEFSEAREHLYRAGFDIYEILAINLVTGISNSLRDFSPDIIGAIFPFYYQTIKPDLLDIQVKLADNRGDKVINPQTGIKDFDSYLPHIHKLKEYAKKTSIMMPELIEEKVRREKSETDQKAAKDKDEKDKKKDKFKERIYGFLLAVILAIIGLGLKYVFEKNFPSSPKIQNTPASDTTIHKSTSLNFKIREDA